MGFYKHILWPLANRTDPEWAHNRTARALSWAQANALGRRLLADMAAPLPDADPIEVLGLSFPNPVGVAAGFDKNVTVAPGLALLGFGHIEVGTLTPRAQPGNAAPRIFRLPEDRALINRMGFPNCGIEDALPRLREFSGAPRDWVLGVSLGKQKDTPLEAAWADYVAVMRPAYPHADYLAINISSPNTPDLRDLQHDAYLRDLLKEVVSERDRLSEEQRVRRPLLVKIAPDLSVEELDSVLDALAGAGIDGVIATNTTLSRGGLRSPRREEAGGLSGEPLRDRSTRIIEHSRARLGPEFPIIGVGGVFDAADARSKLDAGADLVQVYTGLIYEGPGMAGRILRGLESPLNGNFTSGA